VARRDPIRFRDRREYLGISSRVPINLSERISMRFVDPRRVVSSTVGVVSGCHARPGGGGSHEDEGEIRSGDSGRSVHR